MKEYASSGVSLDQMDVVIQEKKKKTASGPMVADQPTPEDD